MTNQLKVKKLRSHIGYQLRLISNAVSHSFATELFHSNVTIAEWIILREIYSIGEKVSPSTVAELTGLTRGAVSKLIDRLFLKELVVRSESSRDRRYQEINLTERAKALVPKLASIADENDKSFFSILTDSERKTLMNILSKIAEFHNIRATPIE